MTALTLFEEARRMGLRLSICGEKLRIEPAPAPGVLNRIKSAKPYLMQLLRLEGAAAQACMGLSPHMKPGQLLARLAPEDLTNLSVAVDPLPFLRSFAIACVWTDLRQDGIAPPGWDKPAHCARCGPVYLWAPIKVAGCPWCWNRLHGLRISRPP
jgi:hypothetical protein